MAHQIDSNLSALPHVKCPACEACGQATRFVGLEAVSGNDYSDLCTYECKACGHNQIDLVPRTGAMNGASVSTTA